MSVAKIKAHFANWREWEPNPIVVKELRQAVRSWSVTGALLLFLLLLFVVTMIFLASMEAGTGGGQQMGATLFGIFLVVLAGSSLIFIPLYVAIRIMAERQHNNPDLIYVTTLSPNRIIFGKFLCGAYMAVLFFSACLPFMAFTNLLRGVDLPTIFFMLLVLFLLVCAINQVAIFLACLPVNRALKTLFIVGAFFQSLFLIGSLSFSFMMMVHSGIGALMFRHEFWVNFGASLGLGLAITGLFFVLSAALISPVSANRALPVRRYVTLLWLFSGVVMFGWAWEAKNFDILLPWASFALILMAYSILVVISNSDDLSLRVRRDIPQSPIKRACAFLFFNGAAGGLVWVAIICLFTCAIAAVISQLALSPKPPIRAAHDSWWHFVEYSVPLIIYLFAYSLTALFIQRKFFPQRPPKLAGLIAVLMVGAWSIIPNFILFFLNRLSWNSVESLQLGNVLNVAALRDDTYLRSHLLFASCWLIIAVVINARWFGHQVKNFSPIPSQPPVIG
jgi:hypothetical protein